MGVRNEMEARRAKREALRREISILQGKISVARELVLDFNTLKAGITALSGDVPGSDDCCGGQIYGFTCW